VSRLPQVLIQNTSTVGRYNVLDLEAEIAREVTFLVTVTGSPSSFSVDLEGGHAVGPIEIYYPLATVTEPGYVTVNSHWVRYLSASLTALTGGSSPTVSVTVAPGRGE
jgi:hypothetical protein